MKKQFVASTTPNEVDWKPTSIKGGRYQIYRNSKGVLSLWLDGKILPGQTDLIWKQEMDSCVEVTVTMLFQ